MGRKICGYRPSWLCGAIPFQRTELHTQKGAQMRQTATSYPLSWWRVQKRFSRIRTSLEKTRFRKDDSGELCAISARRS